MPQGFTDGVVYPLTVAAFLGLGAWMRSMFKVLWQNAAAVGRIEAKLFDPDDGAIPKIRADLATNSSDLRAHRDDDAASFREVHSRIDEYMSGHARQH